MPHTYIRAHTHTKYPHERFETSDVSFADWNFFYEHWLGLSYASAIPAWYSSVPHVSWTRYTTAFAIGNRHDLLQALKGQLAKLDLVTKVCGQAVLFERWRKMPYSRREQLVLRIFENQVRRCEAQRYPFRRDECPEMVLSNLAKDLDFLEDLFHAQVGAPADEDYRIVRNEAWEPLADPRKSGKTQLGAMSSGLQGWVEEGYLSRHLYLAQFTNFWIESLLGKDLPPLDQPLLSSSYRPTADDRRAFDELQVPDHPVSSPAMLNKRDAIKVCAGCSATEKEKKLLACQKCKAAGRNVWYCGADCQRSSWPTHKPACGTPFSASSSAPRPPSTRAPASKDQLAHLDYLAQFPLAIFGMSTSEEDHRGRVTNETDVLFDLPLFVRPFLDARRALLRFRDAAVRTRDDVAVGVTVLFMTLAAKYDTAAARATNDGQRALCVEMIRPLLDMTAAEIETAMAVAEAELATSEESDLKLVAAVFEQLRDGKPDPAYPRQNIPDNRLSRDFLSGLLLRPASFFASYPSDEHLRTMLLPDHVPNHAATLSAARSLSFRSLTAQDPAALGALQLLVRGVLYYDPTRAGSFMIDLRTWARFGAMLGLSEERMREMRERAEEELPRREDEEGRLVWAAVRQLREEGRAKRANEAAPGWVPPAGWPRTAAEVFGPSVYDHPSGSASPPPPDGVAAGPAAELARSFSGLSVQAQADERVEATSKGKKKKSKKRK